MRDFDAYKPTEEAAATPPAEPEVGYGEDMGKGFVGGLGRGTAGLLGLIGDVPEYGARGIDWATRKLTGSDAAPRAPQQSAIGGAAIQKAIEGYTGPFYEPKTIPGQYAGTFGEFLPGSVVPGGGGVGLARTVGAKLLNTAVPAVVSETAGQITKGQPIEPWARGVTGVLGGVAAGKLVTPAAPASAGRQAAVQTLEAEGIPLTAGQRTGSRPLQWMESTAADMPGSATRAGELYGAGKTAYDRAITNRTFDPAELQRRGVPQGAALPDADVMATGRQSLSDEYQRLTGGHQLRSDPRLQSDLTAAETRYNRDVLPSQRTGDVAAIRNDIVDQLITNQGQMPGRLYQTTRSRLGSQAKSSTDVQQAAALRDVRGALDRAMERSLPPAEAEAWRLNNQRWGNMKQLAPAAAAATTENLSPARVAQAVRSGRNEAYAANQGNLDELTKAAAMVMKDLPQSGTGPRTAMQSLFSVPSLLSAGGGGVAGSMFGPLGAAAGALAPFAAARAVVSRPGQAYLGNRALPQNTRDIVAQTLMEQALSQPRVIDRNNKDREEYDRRLRITVNPRRVN